MENYRKARGWLTEAERDALVAYARGTPHGSILINIGVEYGASIICLASGMAPESRVIGIDVDMSKWAGPWKTKRWLMTEADSYKVLQGWDVPDIALLFVDGDHGYEGVKKDIKWLQHLEIGGAVIFHDCYNWPPAPPKTVHSLCPGVNKAVQEWFDSDPGRPGAFFIEEAHVDSMRIFRKLPR